ncbi:MAG TPA: Spy/CpxP family protein refolding chaperone [Burkholderiaceae bacterium]|nr:Spy/CpxP family protein refolding chaperone [Burkholderiaceae bacterium]
MTKLKAAFLAATAALGMAGAALYAREPDERPDGMGPWMMGDYGYGRGPEMRGSGMGPGMMGGWGMGRGFAGGAALSSLDLSDAQRKQVLAVMDQVRKSNWELMGRMQDEMAKQRDAFLDADKRDRAAITAANKRMFELRQQMLDNSLDGTEKIEKILTPQQREQLKKRWGPGWMMGFGE